MVFAGILVIACKFTIKEEMWSSYMTPQGNNYPGSLLSHSRNGANTRKSQREFCLFSPLIPITSGKTFKNPNFVNGFNNHCHIIDKIKEKCPEAIPNFTEKYQQQQQQSKFPSNYTANTIKMCLNSDNNTVIKQQRNREHHKYKKHPQTDKKSKQNLKKKEIKELMLIDNNIQDLCNHSLDNSFSPKTSSEPHNLILEDFIVQKPLIFSSHSPLKKTDPIHIPITKGTEMFVIISPSPMSSPKQSSFSDSDDSFIEFQNDDEQKESEEESVIKKNKQKNRCPSVCESEDSFIVFEKGNENEESDEDDDDVSYISSSEAEDKIDDEEETDSSYSNIDKKKVRFVADENLCEVHPMIKWSYAYQAARKGPWEMYARDRCRFKDRIFRVEREIKRIFNPEHRDRIYKERFENLKN